MKEGRFLEVAGGDWGGLGALSSTASHLQIHLPPTAPTHRLKQSTTYIQLIEVKYCEDTRPQNQLSAAQEQHKGLSFPL